MTASQYSPPVAQLFSYGDAHTNMGEWDGYQPLGITADHIPDLIRILSDESLFQSESEGVDYWAVVHAWRVVAELKAETAIPALIAVLGRWGDEEGWWDWINEELPDVFGAIGTAAIPALVGFIVDTTQAEFPRGTAARSLLEIGQQYPDSRLQCIEGVTQPLQTFDDKTPELNAFLIDVLIELKALESITVIEQAFQLNCVDPSIVGDWDEVQVSLGLKTREEVPLKRFNIMSDMPVRRETYSSFPADLLSFGGESKKSKAKTKRKQQKESRKKNRGKKK
jgi:Protein of unknown function (DUF1186)